MTKTKSTKESTKKKFKMPTSVMILAGILVLLVVMSWIISWSGGTYDDTFSLTFNGGGQVTFDEINSALGTEINSLADFAAVFPDAASNFIQVTIGDDKIPGLENILNSDITLYQDGTSEVIALGIFGVGLAIGNGFVAGADLIFYLFILGAVIELMLVTKTLEAGISGLVKGLGGKELLLIPILFVLFSAGGTIYGMSEETIALFVIVVPALSLAGFDTVTGLMVILGGTATGCAVSTVNPFSIGSADAAAIEAGFEGVMSSILIFNLIWWVIMTAITASMMTGYAWYTRKNPEKSFAKTDKEVAENWLKEVSGSGEDTPQTTGRQKIALGMFMSAFALMVVLFIPWADLVGLDYSTGSKDPIFGGIAILGTWYFAELSMMFIFVGIAIGFVLNMSVEEFSKTAYEGAKAMFSVAVVIAVARGIPYILETTGMQTFLVGGIIEALSGGKGVDSTLFIYLMFIVFIILASFITSTSGLANAAIPLMAPFVSELFPADQQIFVMGGLFIGYMMGIGFWNFFVPTNPIVMASMQYSRVPYQDGVKLAAPMGLTVLVVTIAAMIPSYILIMG